MSDEISVPKNWYLPPGFYFTQSNLQDFVDCPRRFYLRHLIRQPWPSPLAQPQSTVEEAIRRGEIFHRLVERHQRGIVMDTLKRSVEDKAPLPEWLDRYQQKLTAIGSVERRWVEVDLSAALGEHPLRAKFDLIIHQANILHAIDWKTGRLPSKNLLKNRMQTVLYLYVLYHRAKSLLAARPEVIKLEYVGVADGKNYVFTVDSASVTNYAERIQQCIDAVFQSDFAKVDDWQPCKFCLYRGLCERGQSPVVQDVNEVDFDWGLDVDESLEEIEF